MKLINSKLVFLCCMMVILIGNVSECEGTLDWLAKLFSFKPGFSGYGGWGNYRRNRRPFGTALGSGYFGGGTASTAGAGGYLGGGWTGNGNSGWYGSNYYKYGNRFGLLGTNSYGTGRLGDRGNIYPTQSIHHHHIARSSNDQEQI